MKTRTGFVSNSSSSSFLLMIDRDVKPVITVQHTLNLEELRDDYYECGFERISTKEELRRWGKWNWLREDGTFYSDEAQEQYLEYLEILENGRDILIITTDNYGYNYDMLRDVETYKQNPHIKYLRGED